MRVTQSFIQRLNKVSKDHVIADPERLSVYETDGLTAKKQRPGIVVLPETISEIQRVMRLCHSFEVPVVARGAGTGLSGGAMPHEDGVLLGLFTGHVGRVVWQFMSAIVSSFARFISIL